jgi:hypothetical protein
MEANNARKLGKKTMDDQEEAWALPPPSSPFATTPSSLAPLPPPPKVARGATTFLLSYLASNISTFLISHYFFVRGSIIIPVLLLFLVEPDLLFSN